MEEGKKILDLKKLWVLAIPFFIFVALFVLIKSTRQGNSQVEGVQTAATSTPLSTPGSNTNNMENKDQLKIEDIKVGTGDEAVSGKKVTVNYVGTLTNGVKFDSSIDRNQSFTFNLGAGEVIQGWDKGLVGMKVGGKRKLTIPPSLGYGSRDMGSIPANSTLIFEVELLKVE